MICQMLEKEFSRTGLHVHSIFKLLLVQLPNLPYFVHVAFCRGGETFALT